MEGIFDILFSQVNLVLTCLLLLMVVYWLVTMIGGIDYDVDFDVDVDVDIDADVDVDTGIEGGNVDFQDVANAEVDKEHVVGNRGKRLKGWQIFLIYFNFVGLPFMFTLTCNIFIWWFITVLITTMTSTYDNPLGFAILLAAIIPTLFLTKIFTTPFKSFFKNLNKDGDKANDFLGRKGVMLSSISGVKMGNAEVTASGNSMSLYVKSLDGNPIGYGSQILIIKKSEDGNYFLVQAYNE